MKKLIMAAALTLALTTAANAGGDIAPVAATVQVEANKDFYVGMSTTIGESFRGNDMDWFDTTAVGVQAGYTFYRAGTFDVSAEARYSTSWVHSDDIFDYYTYGAYLKPAYDLGAVTVYGLVGYAAVENGRSTDGLAVGGGLAMPFGTSCEAFVDYVSMNDGTEFDIDRGNEVVTLGVNYKF